MKIQWVSHNVPYPPIGGVLQRNYHLVRQAASRAELHLVALRQQALCPDAESVERARTELLRFCASVEILPIDWETSAVRRAALTAGLALPGRLYDVARLHSRAFHTRLAQRGAGGFDVVHLDTIGLAPYRSYFPQTPAVLNHHNIESHMMLRRATNEPRPARRLFMRAQGRRLERFEARVAPGFDCNLVVSELDAGRLATIAPGALSAVIPNGVDTSYFDLPANVAHANTTMIFVGGHGWYPNRDAVTYFLDEIWPRIVHDQPRSKLILIGRAPCPRAVAAARDDPRVEVLGFVDDIREHVGDAAVFICPFREGGGSRLKFLDALAMRKAIVSTAVGAEGLPVRDGEHYLEGNDPAAFARQVLRLFGEPECRARLGERGRQLVERQFEWNVIGASLDAAYRAIGEGR